MFSSFIHLAVVTIISLIHIQASPLHIPHTRGSLSRSRRSAAESQPHDEIVLRQTVEINAENYETQVDQLADTIKQMFRDSAASHRMTVGRSDGSIDSGLFQERRALNGPISVMLETYVISQQVRASSELAENSERRNRHTELLNAMRGADK